MHTIVTTVAELDYGSGPTKQVTFLDAAYIVDKETGTLAIHNTTGTVASFAPGQWRTVVRVGDGPGGLVFRDVDGATQGSLS